MRSGRRTSARWPCSTARPARRRRSHPHRGGPGGGRGRLHLVPRFRQLLYVPRRGLGGPLWVDAPDVRSRRPRRGSCRFRRLATRLSSCSPSSACGGAGWTGPGRYGRCGSCPGCRTVASACSSGCTTPSPTASPAWPLFEFLDATPSAAPDRAAQRGHRRRCRRTRELLPDNLGGGATTPQGALDADAPGDNLAHLRAAWPAMRELVAERPVPATSLDRLVGPDRNLALIRSSLSRSSRSRIRTTRR